MTRTPHIVVLVVDALRSDKLGTYGNAHAKTPEIDSLAAQATMFTKSWSSAPGTGYSVPSFLAGLMPNTIAELRTRPLLLPRALRHFGYSTSISHPIDKFQFYAYPVFENATLDDLGFDEQGRPVYSPKSSSDSALLTGVVERLAESAPPRFEYVHLFSTHGPFLGATSHDDYETAVEAVDKEIGRFRRSLAERVERETILILVADHGEALGEHGMFAHSQGLYQEQIAVPFLILDPRTTPASVTTPTGLYELPHHLFQRLGLAWPIPPALPKRVLGHYAVQEFHKRTWLVDRTIQRPPLAFHESQISGDVKLFDLDADPGELNDIAREHPKLVAELRALSATITDYETALADEIDALRIRPTPP